MMTKVLVLDDDAEVLAAYGRVLGSGQCEVELADDAEQALRLFSLNPEFDVVVTDLHLPVMDGLSFLREVRKIDPDLPVIVVTGHADLSSACASLEHGAHRYLPKPINAEVLRGAVRTAAQMRELARLRRQALEQVDAGPASSGRTTLDARFSAALDTLWIAYQPVVQLSERAIYGYEALVRTYEPGLHYPSALFGLADRLGRLHEVGRHIREQVATALRGAP
ncbi:MAG TPA: response regulator, partial [Polyangiaceae bacterium]